MLQTPQLIEFPHWFVTVPQRPVEHVAGGHTQLFEPLQVLPAGHSARLQSMVQPAPAVMRPQRPLHEKAALHSHELLPA
jgi:hypothetical protein